jgi:hypothetical protein
MSASGTGLPGTLAGDVRGHRGEQVAAMKAGRQPFRPPVDPPGGDRSGPADRRFEQPVVGADQPAPVRVHHQRQPLGADAGVDHRHHYRAGRQKGQQRGQQIARRLGRKGRRVVHQVDRRDARRRLCQRHAHLPDIEAAEPKIREQRNHSQIATKFASY